jgi:hypothetical protein
MSTTTSIQAEASKPQQNQQHKQKKMQECRRCKANGFSNQLIGFEKMGEDPITGKISWKLIDENRQEHKHKFIRSQSSDNLKDFAVKNGNPVVTSISNDNAIRVQDDQKKPDSNNNVFKSRRITDIATVSDIAEARTLIAVGWEYKTSYAATIANIPYYVPVKREQYN